MDENLKLSIITPSYNYGRFLEQTILSVINQDYANVEYIIIDGASSDNSIDIIRKYEKQIAYWVSEPDKDFRYALQKGFSHATGDVVAWQNADDYYEPNVFGQVMEIFQNNLDVDLVFGNVNIVDVNNQQIDQLRNVPIFFPLDIFGGMPFQNQAAFFRRSLWERAGGITFSEYNFDVDLIFRIASLAKPVFIHRAFGNYRKHSGSFSLSGKNKSLQKDFWEIRRRFLGRWSRLPKWCFAPALFLAKVRRYSSLIFGGDWDYVRDHTKRLLYGTTATR